MDIPLHTTFAARSVIAPSFSSFKPQNVKCSSRDSILSIGWSCDGRRLATAGFEKSARIWKPEMLEVRSTTQLSGGHSSTVNDVAWNPTHPELLLTSSHTDRKVVFWDARQSKPTQSFTLPRTPLSFTYSPDGRAVVVIDYNDSAQFLCLGQSTSEEGKELWGVSDQRLSSLRFMEATWNNAGTMVFATTMEGSVRLYKWPSLVHFEKVNSHVGHCNSVDIDPRGKYFVTGGTDSMVNLFDIQELMCVRTWSPVDTIVRMVRFSPDGEYIATSPSDADFIDLSATETGQSLHRIPSQGPVACLAWHPSQNILAFCGDHSKDEASKGWISLFGPST